MDGTLFSGAVFPFPLPNLPLYRGAYLPPGLLQPWGALGKQLEAGQAPSLLTCSQVSTFSSPEQELEVAETLCEPSPCSAP